MIPNYPNFTTLDLCHYKIIQHYIVQEKIPHGDFNFATLWSFNLDSKVYLSILNNNIIICCKENSKRELSYLGTSMPNETTEALLNAVDTINLLPDRLVQDLDQKKFEIKLDRDNSDYILDLSQLSSCRGSRFAAIRHKSNRFVRCASNIKFYVLKNTADTKKIILDFYDRIGDNQNAEKKNALSLEKRALDRFLSLPHPIEAIIFGLFFGAKLVGFVINEKYNESVAIGQFMKVDIAVSKDMYSYIYRKTAEYLFQAGFKHINIEQDLGIPGLRQKKMELRPVLFYNKYNVSLKKY